MKFQLLSKQSWSAKNLGWKKKSSSKKERLMILPERRDEHFENLFVVRRNEKNDNVSNGPFSQ